MSCKQEALRTKIKECEKCLYTYMTLPPALTGGALSRMKQIGKMEVRLQELKDKLSSLAREEREMTENEKRAERMTSLIHSKCMKVKKESGGTVDILTCAVMTNRQYSYPLTEREAVSVGLDVALKEFECP